MIHGDLHLHNVIVTNNGPRLIDPKGLRADPALEFAKALIPPISDGLSDEQSAQMDRHATIMAQAIGATPQRLIQWTAIELAMSTFRMRRGAPFRSERIPLLDALLTRANS